MRFLPSIDFLLFYLLFKSHLPRPDTSKLQHLGVAAKIFLSDRLVGAVTAQGRVRGAHTGNILLKMQQVYIDGACRVIKGSESSFDSLTCCSGSLSFYKREAIQDFIHDWAHDRFLGVEFKFCTDDHSCCTYTNRACNGLG